MKTIKPGPRCINDTGGGGPASFSRGGTALPEARFAIFPIFPAIFPIFPIAGKENGPVPGGFGRIFGMD